MKTSTALFQPRTTEHTLEGMLRARNSLRQQLWAAPLAQAHDWLCHQETGSAACDGGSSCSPDPARLALYQSDLEA